MTAVNPSRVRVTGNECQVGSFSLRISTSAFAMPETRIACETDDPGRVVLASRQQLERRQLGVPAHEDLT